MDGDWRPYAGSQEEFCSRSEFEVLFGGSAGPGKSECLVNLALRHVDKPGYRALILRRTFPRLTELLDRAWKYYPMVGGEWRAGEKRWYFPGSDSSRGQKPFVQFGHMQREEDKFDHHGKQYQWIGFDELTEFTEAQYIYMFSRARSTDPRIPPRVRGATNPGNVGHMWVKERFIDPATPGTVYTDPRTGLSRVFIPGLVFDNPAIMENDPGYIQRLKAMPEIDQKRYLYGDWEIFEGQYFPTLSARVHACDPFDIPPEWDRFMVLDWGFSKPFSVGWYAMDHDGVMYRYREWYGCKDGAADEGVQMIAAEVANGILDREQGEKIRTRYADPAIFHPKPMNRKRESIGTAIAEDFSNAGVFFLKADNARELGWQQVQKRFQLERDIDTETGEVVNEYPRFIAFNDQLHFWRTVPTLRRDPKNPEDVDTKQEDHIADELRYGCMSRPIATKVAPRGAPVGSFAYERQKLIRAKRRARREGISVTEAYTRGR